MDADGGAGNGQLELGGSKPDQTTSKQQATPVSPSHARKHESRRYTPPLLAPVASWTGGRERHGSRHAPLVSCCCRLQKPIILRFPSLLLQLPPTTSSSQLQTPHQEKTPAEKNTQEPCLFSFLPPFLRLLFPRNKSQRILLIILSSRSLREVA